MALECENIYYHREVVIRSFDGHSLDMLTISSKNLIKRQREETIADLFPDDEDDSHFTHLEPRVEDQKKLSKLASGRSQTYIL